MVEAAAGTGKTTVLVNRLVSILREGRGKVEKLVAVTFTRKAAGELKLRLRQELETARDKATDSRSMSHLEDAISRLEEARRGRCRKSGRLASGIGRSYEKVGGRGGECFQPTRRGLGNAFAHWSRRLRVSECIRAQSRPQKMVKKQGDQ